MKKPQAIGMAAIVAACASVAAGGNVALAQAVSRPVVQSLPPPSVSALDDALMDLARNPRDPGALVRAGMAALDLGDTDAAVGFFSRAQEVSPSDPRAKAGMGAAQVMNENPYDALLMFDEADRSGGSPDFLAGARGLAWDLVGDNLQAQQFYRRALARGSDPEITRRLALSLAVSGDSDGAEKVLQPLVNKGDGAALRTQAFIEAIAGNMDEAQKIAVRALPGRAGQQIVPYLRYMPKLTAAQQVAAATFGHFPRTADIGQDDPRIAKYAKDALQRRAEQAADSTLIPTGEPLGRKLSKREQRELARKAKAAMKANAEADARAAAEKERLKQQAALRQVEADRAARAKAALASSVPTPAPVPRPSLAVSTAPASDHNSALANVRAAQVSGELPALGEQQAAQSVEAPVPQSPAPSAPPAPSASAWPAGSTVAAGASAIASFAIPSSGEPQTPAAPEPAPAQPAAAAPALAPAPPAPVSAPLPAPAPEPEPTRRSVADAFAGFAVAPSQAPVSSGAVDITRIKPRIEQPPAPEPAAKVEKPAPPPHPSRHWVQVATGRDVSALKWDWRRISRTAPDLLKGKKPFTASWGQTNRMVTGPFDTSKAAQQFVTDLKDKGIDSFTFTSDDGEAVDPLPGVK